ncbi:MAG TPA: DUF885 domain-containing protein [Rhizomicrobium sp.]|nr:DUF885 domain-containing protein [Rhizomicrobium sp.]
MRKLFLAALLALIAFAPAQASPAGDLASLVKDYDEAQLVLYPSTALWRGDRRYLGKYEDDLSAAHLAERRKENAEFRARLSGIDRAQLDAEDQLSYDIFDYNLADDAGALAPGLGEHFQMLPLDQFNGNHVSFAVEMEWRSRFPFNTVADYESAISRMNGFAHWIDMAIARMREGEAQGITQPRVIVERMIPQADEQANKSVEESVFYGPVKNMPDAIKGDDRARIAKEYRATVGDVVIPAYRRLANFLKDEYLPKARASVGLEAMPGGNEMYLYLVHHHTTLERTPAEIHAIGLAEVERITAEMERVKNQTGFKGDLPAFRTFLRNDPRFKFKDEGQMLAAYQAVKAKIAAGLPRLFDRQPKTPYEIKFFPDFVGPTQAAAQYNQPSEDGSRPGIFYINGYDLPSRPTYSTEVLSLHESMPGHHMQIALSMENNSLPAFRRFNGPTAFVEGWGLYTESLGKDLGLYTDPYQQFAQLSFDMWRACRLVVDTGMHAEGMSREDAIDYMLANTSLTKTDVTAEVERYIAYPGQALAYKSGQLELFKLRDEAKAALGAKFDIRKFHDAVLMDGAMPLSILDGKIHRWIAQQARY